MYCNHIFHSYSNLKNTKVDILAIHRTKNENAHRYAVRRKKIERERDSVGNGNEKVDTKRSTRNMTRKE